MPPKKAKKSSAGTRKAATRSRSSSGQPMDADVELDSLLKLLDPKSPSPPYRRQLKKPIVRASKLELMLRGSPEEQERHGREEDSRIVAEQFGKLFLLLDHFGIPQTSRLRWFHLAFQLARQHVPGMEVISSQKSRRGAKIKWRDSLNAELIVAVAKLKRERKRGAADAIRTLSNRESDVWAVRRQNI